MLLQKISYPELINILNDYTRKFIKFLLTGASQKDLDHCKRTLDSLMVELKRRRQHRNNEQFQQANLVLNMLDNRAMSN